MDYHSIIYHEDDMGKFSKLEKKTLQQMFLDYIFKLLLAV